MPASPSTPYKVCEGLPHNEDVNCSNGLITFKPCTVDIFTLCVCYHTHYFDTFVGQVCNGNNTCNCCTANDAADMAQATIQTKPKLMV